MNYYRKYPGDYAADTSHLSCTEHGAYSQLLDYCYAKDTISIPDSESRLYQICSATTRQEKEAVRTVVAEFFPGGTNPRIRRQLPEELDIRNSAKDKARKGGEAKRDKQEPSPSSASSTPPSTTPSSASSTTPSSASGCALRSPTPISDPLPLPLPPLLTQESKKQIPLSCTELREEAAQTHVPNGSGVFLKTCRLGEEWEVPCEKMAQWKEAYPDVNIRQTLLEIRQWLRDNEDRRKTARGMTKFVGAWMQREQNKPDTGNDYGKRTTRH